MPPSQGLPSAPGSARWLRRLLWFQGNLDLLAVLFPLLPMDTIARLHAGLGLGEFPRSAIAAYLARNLPLMVALHGMMLWGVATYLEIGRAHV